MKNKFVRVFSLIGLVIATSSLCISCNPEDGVSGLNGENGINGINGENGIGFDDLTKYGSVTATLAGTRIDDVDFTQTSEFKFTGAAGDDIDGYNSVEVSGDDLEFEFYRFISSPEDTYNENAIYIYLYVTDAGLATESFEFQVGFEGHAIIGDDLKFFNYDEYWDYDDFGVSNAAITNYSFNDTTNELSFSYTLDVAGSENDTGNDLTISGEVNVIVLEEVQELAEPELP